MHVTPKVLRYFEVKPNYLVFAILAAHVCYLLRETKRQQGIKLRGTHQNNHKFLYNCQVKDHE